MAKIKVTNKNIAKPFQKMSVVSDFLALVGDDRTGSGVSFDSSLLYLSLFEDGKSDPP